MSHSWQLWPTKTTTTAKTSLHSVAVGASVLLLTWPRLICRKGHWSASATEREREKRKENEIKKRDLQS